MIPFVSSAYFARRSLSGEAWRHHLVSWCPSLEISLISLHFFVRLAWAWMNYHDAQAAPSSTLTERTYGRVVLETWTLEALVGVNFRELSTAVRSGLYGGDVLLAMEECQPSSDVTYERGSSGQVTEILKEQIETPRRARRSRGRLAHALMKPPGNNFGLTHFLS